MTYSGGNASVDFALRNNPGIVKTGALAVEGSLDGNYSVTPDSEYGFNPATLEA
ncbi:MAG: hypothetical protein AAGB32_01085 [Pseudomonadota bacterium]